MTIRVDNYVTQKGSEQPVGIVEEIWQGTTGVFARVRWGTADNRTFKDEFPIDGLEIVEERIWTSDEINERQAKEAGGHLIEE